MHKSGGAKLSKIERLIKFARSSDSGYVITMEVLLGIVLCFLSLAIFVFFAREVLETDFNHLDIQFSMAVYALRTPELTVIMKAITALGFSFPIYLSILILIALLIRKHRREATLFCLALIIGAVLNSSFKLIAQRPRPQISPLVIEQTYSFPSSHAMNSFLFYALIAYFSYHFFRDKKLSIVFSIGCGIVVLLIGFSRIYLGVHYLTDVIAGYIVGFWWFVSMLLIERTFVFYRVFTHHQKG